MTANDYSEKDRFRHSDKAPGRNLDAIASKFSSANGEPFNGEPVSLALSNTQLATTGHGFPKSRSRNKFGMTEWRAPIDCCPDNFQPLLSPHFDLSFLYGSICGINCISGVLTRSNSAMRLSHYLQVDGIVKVVLFVIKSRW